MRNDTAIFLCACLLFGVCCFAPNTAHAESESPVEYPEDGGRIETTIEDNWNSFAIDHPSDFVDLGFHDETDSRYTYIKRTLTRFYYDADNHADWKAVLFAEFKVGGLRAVCTDWGTYSIIYDDAWQSSTPKVNCKRNTCAATFTFTCRSSGVVIRTVETTLQLTCDRKGNVTAGPQEQALNLNGLQRWLAALQAFFRRFFSR